MPHGLGDLLSPRARPSASLLAEVRNDISNLGSSPRGTAGVGVESVGFSTMLPRAKIGARLAFFYTSAISGRNVRENQTSAILTRFSTLIPPGPYGEPGIEKLNRNEPTFCTTSSDHVAMLGVIGGCACSVTTRIGTISHSDALPFCVVEPFGRDAFTASQTGVSHGVSISSTQTFRNDHKPYTRTLSYTCLTP